MTVSAFQIDDVIKAYSKQGKVKVRRDDPQAVSQSRYLDVVTLSGNESQKAAADQKAGVNLKTNTDKKNTYSLLDILIKEKNTTP